MIRELMVNGAKNIPANYAAKVDMVTGMGVQVDHKAGQVKFPDAATAEGIEIRDDGLAGVRCDRTFVDAVLTGDATKIRSPYSDALRSLEFTLACNFSQEIGSPVEL